MEIFSKLRVFKIGFRKEGLIEDRDCEIGSSCEFLIESGDCPLRLETLREYLSFGGESLDVKLVCIFIGG